MCSGRASTSRIETLFWGNNQPRFGATTNQERRNTVRNLVRRIALLGSLAIAGLAWLAITNSAAAQDQNCSAWLIESSRFMNVPMGGFIPDRAFILGSTDQNHNLNTVE